jgi:transketolase
VSDLSFCLAIADVVASLFGQVLRVAAPNEPERDRLILADDRAVPAVIAALVIKGWIGQEDLERFGASDSFRSLFPDRRPPGVDFSPTSPGQGLSIGAGAAMAALMQRSPRRAFVLLSDAECREELTWEMARFASQRRLANLVAILAIPRQYAPDEVDGILDFSLLADRWRTFGWDVHEVDGHDHAQLISAVTNIDPYSGQPHVIIARLVLGRVTS